MPSTAAVPLQGLFAATTVWPLAFAVAMPRLFVCVSMLPAFSFSVMGARWRASVAMALALPCAAPLVATLQQAPVESLSLFLLIAKEAAIGAGMGAVLTVPFWIAESVGSITDVQRGANIASQLNRSTDPQASLLGPALQQALVILLFESGAQGAMLSLVYRSYTVWPPLQWLPLPHLVMTGAFIRLFSALAEAAVLYAAPVIVVLWLIDLAFGLLNTMAPQVEVFFAATPIKSLVALIVLIMYASLLWYLLGTQAQHALDTLRAVFASATAGVARP
jgi:type III secretion protein T